MQPFRVVFSRIQNFFKTYILTYLKHMAYLDELILVKSLSYTLDRKEGNSELRARRFLSVDNNPNCNVCNTVVTQGEYLIELSAINQLNQFALKLPKKLIPDHLMETMLSPVKLSHTLRSPISEKVNALFKS